MRCAQLALIASVCSGLAGAALADAPAPSRAAAMLPTPYTAEQIREAWQPGFSVEMRTTEAGAESRGRMTVLTATPESCVIRSESFAASGEASEPPDEFNAKWSELRDHALFEAAKAKRERAECRSQLGLMPGWRYIVPQANGDTLTMCFADATPGPPVEYETLRGGAVGSRTEHVNYGRPPGGAAEERGQ
jgi:hypothetical protein